MLALGLGAAADGLAVGHARRLEVDLDVEAALHAFDGDFDVDLTHARDDHLAGLRVACDVHHRVFFGQAAQRADDLVLVALGLGLHGERHEGRRVLDGREPGGAVGRQRVAGDDVLELGHRADVAGHELLDGLGLFALLLEQRAQPFLVTASDHDEVAVARHRALEDAEDVDASAELVGDGLEHERGGGLGGIGRELDVGAVGGPAADRPRRGRRRRQREQIEKQVDAGEVRRRADRQREHLGVSHGGGEALLQLGLGELFFHEELLGELVARFGDDLDERVAQLLCAGDEIGRHLAFDDLLALDRVGLHAQHVDDALEVVLAADRELHRNDLVTEGLAQHGQTTVEVGALAIEHVAEQDTGETSLGGACPEALGLDLDAHHGVDHDERRLDDPQGADRV